MTRKLLLILMAQGALALGGCQPSSSRTGENDAAARAIRERVDSYVAAYNARDAEAVAEHWAEDAVLISRSSGRRIEGREAILEEFTEIFEDDPDVTLDVSVTSLRFMAPTVAVEEGTARVTRPGAPVSESSYTAIHRRQGNTWYIDNVREIDLPERVSHYDQLRELEWMIGEWVDADESASIHTVCEWTKNRNFITRSFSVVVEDRVELEGTQVIGWDPAAGQFRSWVFDSDGGFAEGVWTRYEDRWVINSSGVLQDGARAASVNIITPVDADSFTWQSVNREVDGELLPNIDAVTVVRQQAAAPEEEEE